MSLADLVEVPVTGLLGLIPWEEGRQGKGYKRWCIFSSPNLEVDCYLLYMPTGSKVPPHTDPVTDRDHYRVNVILRQPESGGEFLGNAIIKGQRLIYFRPDQVKHEVREVKEGYRLVLSVGWLK